MSTTKNLCAAVPTVLVIPAVLLTAGAVLGVAALMSLSSWELL